MVKSHHAVLAALILALSAATPAAHRGAAAHAPEPAAAALLTATDLENGQAAMALARKSNFAAAEAALRTAQEPLLGKLIRWLELREPGRRGGFAQIAAFLADNPDWPAQDALRQRAEISLPADMANQAVLEWFAAHPAISVTGVMRHATALLAAGDDDQAAELLRRSWVESDLSAADEGVFRRRFGASLRKEDHVARLDRLLWQGKATAAKRLAGRLGGGYPALAEARLALAAMRGGVDGALQRVPAELAGDWGLLFERARWRQRKGRVQGVFELLDPPRPEAPRPEAWWPLRHWAVRQALLQGDISVAHRIASAHGLSAGPAFAEAEWLAGWIALRFLDQPGLAYGHFARLHALVTTPISRARAAFWAGEAARTLEHRQPADHWHAVASLWFATAAKFKTTFYGQLACRRLGESPTLPVTASAPPDAEAQAAFAERELVRVVRLLGEMGESELQEQFLGRLTTLAQSESDYVQTADLAQQLGRPDLAVKTAKAAATAGIMLVDYLFPFPVLPEGTSPEPALVLAVVRQESAFNASAVSSAGAQGLMQILPRTAKGVARNMKLKFNSKQLRADPEYNMTLGRAYLSDLTARYGGSYILALAAYNAGPSRANSWIRAFGDPRDPAVDPVDWIESIPFDETRNYVQRILEGLAVYRQKMGVDSHGSDFDHFADPPPLETSAKRALPADISCCL